MPLFSNSTGIHISGGNFYDVGGNLSIRNNQQLLVQDHQHAESGGSPGILEGTPTQQSLGWDDSDGGRTFVGALRNSRHAGRENAAIALWCASIWIYAYVSLRYQTQSQSDLQPAYDQASSSSSLAGALVMPSSTTSPFDHPSLPSHPVPQFYDSTLTSGNAGWSIPRPSRPLPPHFHHDNQAIECIPPPALPFDFSTHFDLGSSMES
ncbi:hypothetical protein C8J57DRAFT_1220057 [Mycena rebaudengoi]|nr:hypothetical protein C8J57DRAFT_1220057 [Mycena rebaudengoi]